MKKISFVLPLAGLWLATPAIAQTAAQASASPADTAMMAGMTKMHQAMIAAPLTGNADQDFVAMMLPHHQGAVSMAQVELRYGHDPQMRRLAREIIKSQDEEILEMRAWQKRHPRR